MWFIPLLFACSRTESKDDTSGTTATDSVPDSTETGSTDTGSTSSQTIEAALGGLRWELPCLEDGAPSLCTTEATVHTEAVMVGEPGQSYAVTLRFRGVIEPKTYTGGTATGPGWNQDGTPATDTANIYALVVSEPPATFYVNAGTTRTSSELWALAMDIEVEVPIAEGATVGLDAQSLDALQIRNIDENGMPIVVDGVPPAPEPYDGQFIQMDVVRVAEAGEE